MQDRILLIWALTASVVAIWSFLTPDLSLVLGDMWKNAVSAPTGFQTASQPSLIPEVSASRPQKRNIIFMVSDGMGPASLSMARSFRQHIYGLDPLSALTLDDHFLGHSRTRSSDSLVTDSAAGATAFSCALKTYNGAIGVDPEGQPCATILEAAKLAGYMTGLAVTTRVTDATPASFASHAHLRSEEDFIAEQLVGNSHPWGRMTDVIIGGGRCHFLPSSMSGGCRRDHRNLVEEAESEGWTYLSTLPDANEKLPVLSLLSRGDIPFDVDRRHHHKYPHLRDQALAAVELLAKGTADSDQGFFLLVEGSRIDHAGHSNDPAAQVHEVLAYDDTFKAMVEFAQNSSVPTVVLSTSDHETGGLSVARQITPEYPDYLWLPEVLANVSQSTEYLANKLRHYKASGPKHLRKYVEDFVLGAPGLNLAGPTDEEIKLVMENAHNAHDALSKIISIRAQIGWSTHGHSAVDVNVYGWASDEATLAPLLGGNENIELGAFMQDFLNLNAAEHTPKLREDFGDAF